MDKHLIVLGIAILLLSIGLSGCFEAYSSDIRGVWHEGDDITWDFRKNDVLIQTIDGNEITYGWDMDSRWIYVINDVYTMKFSYELLNDGKTLLLESWEWGDHTLRK